MFYSVFHLQTTKTKIFFNIINIFFFCSLTRIIRKSYILHRPPLDQTIEGRHSQRKKLMSIRKNDDSSLPNGKLGEGYTGKQEQIRLTVDPSVLTTRIGDLWPACIYLGNQKVLYLFFNIFLQFIFIISFYF